MELKNLLGVKVKPNFATFVSFVNFKLTMETTQCVCDKYKMYSVNRDTSDKKVYWIVVGRF